MDNSYPEVLDSRIAHLTARAKDFPAQIEYCCSLLKGSKRPRMRKGARPVVALAVLHARVRNVVNTCVDKFRMPTYTVVCDHTNNNEDTITQNELVVDITVHNPTQEIVDAFARQS